MNIVLIDDDPVVLHVLSSLFRHRGHVVKTYETPLACPLYTAVSCPCSSGECPDIIISDVDMPNVDGVSFVEAVFNKQCKCKHVALLSGRDLSDLDQKRISRVGVKFFTKPLDFAEFDAWTMLPEGSRPCAPSE